MARPFLFAVGLLVAATVQAQSVTLTPSNNPTASSLTFSGPRGTKTDSNYHCDDMLDVTWTSSLVTTPAAALQLWSTANQCGDAPTTGDVRYMDIPFLTLITPPRTDHFAISLSALPGFTSSDAGVVCGSLGVNLQMEICGSYSLYGVNGITTVQHAQFLNVIYDTQPPASPTIESISAQDSALKVNFSVTSDTLKVHFEAKAMGEADFTERLAVDVTSATSAQIPHLIDGTTYEIRARAEDAAGNVSEPSEAQVATPIRTDGFFNSYRRAGGTEQGGCTVVHGLPLALAGGLWLLRKKRS